MPPGRVVATEGEVGIQADVLKPGLHFLNPFTERLFGRPVPTSIVQLWLPRVELHLFYNTVVFVPMVIGMYFHMFPPAEETERMACSCAWHPRPAAAG